MKSLLLTITAILVAVACRAAEPGSKVQVSWATKGELWAGQKAVLAVELQAPGYFADAAVFDLPKISRTLILPPESSPTLSSLEVDGVNYIVQRHELAVFSYQAGKIEIPPFKIRFGIKRNALDHDAVAQEVETQAISFETKAVPGSKPGEFLITSADLKVEESWKPEPGKTAKTGDAFVRTLVWSASDVPGMAFPPFMAEPIAGLGIYPAEPIVDDKAERASLLGQRTDAVTYVCKAGGIVTIPALALRWWDPVAQEMKHADFPARVIDVAAPPVPEVSRRTKVERFVRENGKAIGIGGMLLAGLVWGIYRSRAALGKALRRLLPRHLASLNPG